MSNMDRTTLTLMAVHAHPDDEASSTGGTLAKYGAESITTVLVTCTNGELGDGPGGVKPGEPDHDEEKVVDLRRRELEGSCRILGVSHLEMLGYRDSGMEGWDFNRAPGAFATLPVEKAAVPLVGLIDRYRPDVVVTYDDFGFYGHPDHIQAHRITMAALDQVGFPVKLYFPAIRRSRLGEFRTRVAEAGFDPPNFDESRFGSADDEIGATIDCRDQSTAKLSALRAHASQVENIFFTRFDDVMFAEMFGIEEFVRFRDHTGAEGLETDLFSGLR